MNFNWEAISAIAGAVGSTALIVTIAYLAVQVRHLKQQSVLTSYQYTYTAINKFDESVAQSEELASIIVRGRNSLDDLNPSERLRFEHVFGRLLNIVESWYFQLTETADTGPYHDEQVRNIREFVRTRCNHPGVLAFWNQYKQCYNLAMHQLIEKNTGPQVPKTLLKPSALGDPA